MNYSINASTIPLLIIFFLVLKRMGIIKKEWAQPLSFIGFNIGLSSLIFLSFLQSPLSYRMLFNPVIGFLFALQLFIIGFIIAKIIRMPEERRPIFISSLVTLEGGSIGYPFFIAIFGVKNLPRIALIDLGMATFAFTILTFYFYRSTRGYKKNLGEQFINVLKIPILPAMITGLILNLLGIGISPNGPIEKSFLTLLNSLAGIAIPLIIMSIVLDLEVNTKAVLRTFPFAWGSILSTIILGILWIAILPLDIVSKGALLVMCFLPPSLYPSVLSEGLNLSENKRKYATQLFSVTVFISILLLSLFSPFIPKLLNILP